MTPMNELSPEEALIECGRIARDLATTSGVSYREAFETLRDSLRLVEKARADGAAEVWTRYARQYENAAKMPRWDEDKVVTANSWQAGRCGNCGEALPRVAAAGEEEG
jgi:hypothetical protein